MGGELVTLYLRRKLSSTLKEAEDDPNSPSLIVSRIRSIEDSSSLIPVELLYDLIDALSKCRIFAYERHKEAASKKGFYLFRLLMFERKMRKQLDAIEMKLKSTTRPLANRTSPSEAPLTAPNITDPTQIIGFESHVKDIEDWLVESTAIGIVGRCGCGKTTLAQKVFASPNIQKEFSPRIWVCLSDMLLDNKRVDMRVRLLNYILGEIDHHVSELEYSEVKLLGKLQRGLMGKRFLIILDNAWRKEEWFADLMGSGTGESLAHGLPKGSRGAVIVTSREENIIKQMVGDKYVIRPQFSNEICWNIFSGAMPQQLKIYQDSHPKLIEMKDAVIKNCDGLPLAAKTLGNIIPKLLVQNTHDPLFQMV